ncbi:cobyric acid synthase [Blastochloris viridis]|uniref:Cobyric acid synthase n=1 Tax=Blastochloris viridis TaxID=1079 RepID=A0A0H5BJA0_BLAVI|nr:cobyric acid synthase [Blastochloris viridis]ALK09585.1 Cobyric acid synthase [Blastochloris viridis]BAS00527.1 cobyric acid synthase [Blastochloris viridis]CUU42248.1 Cobyric acid synthase [Blastochloris viridis]
MAARVLMFQGTGSDVGKSLLVAGLARLFARRGVTVRPFKPQNMSNNAAVTADGGEIGRSQALQARAALALTSVHMNPVLLKPQGGNGAQIVVQGKVWGEASPRDYQAAKKTLMPYVLDSFDRLKAEADLVLVEGAGAAGEINLRANDIANMGFAQAAQVPVVLVGDIDRGGVIASLVGTRAVLTRDDARLIAGFIVNKMRGDPGLFADGMAFVAAHTGWAPVGLVPFFDAAHKLPAEDAMSLLGSAEPGRTRAAWVTAGPLTPAGLSADPSAGLAGAAAALGRRLRVVAPVLPNIANFDDLDPLKLEPAVELILLHDGAPLPVDADFVVLPGSKATIADLAVLRAAGWDADLIAYARRGGRILGLCGGYQMLGHTVSDPDGVEGVRANVPGLGLLDIDTVLTSDKTLAAAAGETIADGVPFAGYEMHMGRSAGPATTRPMVRLKDGRVDGATSPDGRIAGCYVHGLFADNRQRAAWLARLDAPPSGLDYDATVDATLDALADHLAAHLDIDMLLHLAH